MTLLILGGTAEGRQLAKAVAGMTQVAAVMSLAGAVRSPRALPLPTRIGGFGGDAGFVAFCRAQGIRAVLDATHPFAQRITARTARLCAQMGLPYLQLLRPGWVPEPGDHWPQIEDESAAAAHIAPGATVFLATGRQTLERFANLPDCRVICRQIDPPSGPFPFAGGAFLVGRPPFSVADEQALFARLGVDVLVVKNAGGEASRTKLTAARALGIKVLMIRRPPMGDWPVVSTVAAACDWVVRL